MKKTSLSGTNIYIGDLFEVRNGQLIKHIFAGSQRIASLVGQAPPGGGGGGFGCTSPKGCSLGQHTEPTWQDVINLLPFLLLLAGMGIVRGRVHPRGFLRKHPVYKLWVLLLASVFVWSAWPPMPARAQGSPETVLYYHTDHLGSSSLITDDQGLIVQRISFTPFGGIRQNNSITVDVPYKFTGTELDAETGLYHMGARYYSPLLGRFLTPDPNIPSPSNPQILNRYSYVMNNPLKYIDPTGQDIFSDAWEGVKSAFKGASEAIAGGWEDVKQAANYVWNNISYAATQTWNFVVDVAVYTAASVILVNTLLTELEPIFDPAALALILLASWATNVPIISYMWSIGLGMALGALVYWKVADMVGDRQSFALFKGIFTGAELGFHYGSTGKWYSPDVNLNIKGNYKLADFFGKGAPDTILMLEAIQGNNVDATKASGLGPALLVQITKDYSQQIKQKYPGLLIINFYNGLVAGAKDYHTYLAFSGTMLYMSWMSTIL